MRRALLVKAPLLQGASPSSRGSGVMQDFPQQAEPETWLPKRRGGGLGPWPPASPCMGEAAEGRKCRVLTPHFHRGDGWLSSVLHRASCCSPGPGLLPGCWGGRGHAGCHRLQPDPSQCPAMLWYQLSPAVGRGKLSHCPAPAALRQTHPWGRIHGSGRRLLVLLMAGGTRSCSRWD